MTVPPPIRSPFARLADLLGREHAAMADFLLALADFDRRRLWEPPSPPSNASH